MTWMRTVKRLAVLVGIVLVTGAFAPAAQAQSDPVIAASGDQVCGTDTGGPPVTTSSGCRQVQTANVLDQIRATRLDAILPLGDVQYECGELSNFNTFYTPSWGRSALKAITRPAIGNHEYRFADGTNECLPVSQGGNDSNNGRGYFTYFGSALASPLDPGCVAGCRGYYSYNLGNWHLIALNSNCSRVGGCGSTSPQANWLRSDLAANAGKNCFLAYWHAPRWSSGGRQTSSVQTLWEILRDNNADVVLTGHDHTYERFGKLGRGSAAAVDPAPDPNGIRQWIVGVGGRNFTSFTTIRQVSERRDRSAMGVLKLTLKNNSYDWQFVPEAGKTFTDTGTAACNGAATAPPAGDTTAPTVSTRAPASGATGIAVGSDVTATFSERVIGVSGSTFQLARASAPSPPVEAVLTGSGTTWTLNPNADLAPNTTYNVTLIGGASAIRDEAGNALQTPGSWTFTTGAANDTTRPTVTAQSPASGATGVAVGSNVTATFSETVQGVTGGATGGTFQLTNNATGAVIPTAAPTASGTTWTLNPTNDLTANTVYRVTLTGGSSAIRDASNNALTTTSWTFTTATGGGPTSREVPVFPEADTMVKQAATTNFGSVTQLQVDSQDVSGVASAIHSYLRFNIPALAAGETITGARLSLRTSSTSSAATANGPAIWRTDTGWSETAAMTWNTGQPSRTGTSAVGNFAGMPAAARSTTAVSGITGAGLVSFELAPESSDGLDFLSREDGGTGSDPAGTANDPQLVVTITTP